MKTFDWTEFLYSGYRMAVHCKTKEEAEDFCKQMDAHGQRWGSGDSYLDINYWNNYTKDTCYSNRHGYSPISFYEEEGYMIAEWGEFMDEFYVEPIEQFLKRTGREDSYEDI